MNAQNLPTSQTPSTSATSLPVPQKPSPPTTEAASPLGDPGPDSITELFSRYPDVPKDAARKVVAHLRATRGKIGLDQKPIKEPKAKAAPKPGKAKLSAAELADLLDGDIF